jgi:hypothetical protein
VQVTYEHSFGRLGNALQEEWAHTFLDLLKRIELWIRVALWALQNMYHQHGSIMTGED